MMTDEEIHIRFFLDDDDAVRFADQSVEMQSEPKIKEIAECLYRAAFELKDVHSEVDFDEPAPLYADQAYGVLANPALRERLIAALQDAPTNTGETT